MNKTVNVTTKCKTLYVTQEKSNKHNAKPDKGLRTHGRLTKLSTRKKGGVKRRM